MMEGQDRGLREISRMPGCDVSTVTRSLGDMEGADRLEHFEKALQQE